MSKSAIVALTKDRDPLVMPFSTTNPTGTGEVGDNNTNKDIAQRDGAGSRNPAVSPTGRTTNSQFGWKEIPVPSYMHKEGSKPIDIRSDSQAFVHTSTYKSATVSLLTQDARLKNYGINTTTVIGDGRRAHTMCLADYKYWGS